MCEANHSWSPYLEYIVYASLKSFWELEKSSLDSKIPCHKYHVTEDGILLLSDEFGDVSHLHKW